MHVVDAVSLDECVFFMMTWQRPVVGPTVVALCIEILLAIVPSICQYLSLRSRGTQAYLVFQRLFQEA